MPRFCVPLLVLVLAVGTGPSFGQTAKRRSKSSKPSSLSAEEQLRIRLEVRPHDKQAHQQLVNLLLKKGAFRSAVLEDASWIEKNPSDCNFELADLVGYSKIALNDPEFAIQHLRSYLASASRADDPDTYDNTEDQLAVLLDDRGRPEEALPLLNELVRLNPEEAGFWLDYGVALSDAGHQSEAVQAIQRSIELNPSQEATHEWLAKVFLKMDNLEGAETEYRAVLSIYDAQAKEPTDSMHALMNKLTKSRAERHEESWLAKTRLSLAHVLLLANKFDDAIAQTRAALDADHNGLSAFYLRAEIEDAKGDHEAARETREMAAAVIRKEAAEEFSKSGKKLDIDPRVLFLSDPLWNGESGGPAFPSEIATILEPRDATSSMAERVMLAEAYFALNRIGDGKQEWERAIREYPAGDNAIGHHNLGEMLLKGDAPREALPHLRRAYELDAQNVTYRMDYQGTEEIVAKQ